MPALRDGPAAARAHPRWPRSRPAGDSGYDEVREYHRHRLPRSHPNGTTPPPMSRAQRAHPGAAVLGQPRRPWASPCATSSPTSTRSQLFRGQWQYQRAPAARPNTPRFVEDEVRPVFRRMAGTRDRGAAARAAGGLRLLPLPRRTERPGRLAGRRGWRPRRRARPLRIPAPADRPPPLHRRLLPLGRRSRRRRQRPALRCRRPHARHHGRTRQRIRRSSSSRRNDYRDYLHLHGFAVESAEALAELWHKRSPPRTRHRRRTTRPDVRKLFAQGYQGSRYSFGYPACPDLEEQVEDRRAARPRPHRRRTQRDVPVAPGTDARAPSSSTTRPRGTSSSVSPGRALPEVAPLSRRWLPPALFVLPALVLAAGLPGLAQP